MTERAAVYVACVHSRSRSRIPREANSGPVQRGKINGAVPVRSDILEQYLYVPNGAIPVWKLPLRISPPAGLFVRDRDWRWRLPRYFVLWNSQSGIWFPLSPLSLSPYRTCTHIPKRNGRDAGNARLRTKSTAQFLWSLRCSNTMCIMFD